MGSCYRSRLWNRQASLLYRFTVSEYCWLFQGQVLTELTPFKQVYGVDASDVMLAEAKKTVEKLSLPQQVRFVKSTAENLSYFKDGSVDMIFSGPFPPSFFCSALIPHATRQVKPPIGSITTSYGKNLLAFSNRTEASLFGATRNSEAPNTPL